MRQWQQALQAEQIIDAGPNRVFPLSAFQITETKEGGMMVITTTRITQMHEYSENVARRARKCSRDPLERRPMVGRRA